MDQKVIINIRQVELRENKLAYTNMCYVDKGVFKGLHV